MGEISNGTRILLIQYLLKRLTDQNHALSRDELISRISSISASVSGNTIKSDIESIKTFDNLINVYNDILIQPFESNSGGKINYVTKQKKGSYVEKPFYSDAQLILLANLLNKISYLENQEEPKLIEKVLSDSSIYRINHYHLLDNINSTNDNSIYSNLELIINAINSHSCLDFKCLEYNIINNKLTDTVNSQSILLYPTNIELKNDLVYVSGYQYTKDADFELKYYRLDRITDLKICYCPKNIQNKMEAFKTKTWQKSDPLKLDTKNKINLKLRVYLGNTDIFEKLALYFKNNISQIEQFHQFIEISINDVNNDNDLLTNLLQIASHVEVLKPIELRDKLKDEIQRMYTIYRI